MRLYSTTELLLRNICKLNKTGDIEIRHKWQVHFFPQCEHHLSLEYALACRLWHKKPQALLLQCTSAHKLD